MSLFFRRRFTFIPIYAALCAAVFLTTPLFGRQALPCFDDGPIVMRSPIYCALNRQYISSEMKATVTDIATDVRKAFPGTTTVALDGNFPFVEGFPLLPHLSHDDGNSLDLAFYYSKEGVYLPGVTKSPIGYFAFEAGANSCSKSGLMRWDLAALQPLWPGYEIDAQRTAFLVRRAAQDRRIGKIFLEPHLVQKMGVQHPKVRFQGCHAARHDDHIHLQL